MLPAENEPLIARANIGLILDRIAHGHSAKDIAAELDISERTITALERRNSDVRARIRTARAVGAHRMVEEALAIADETQHHPSINPYKSAALRIDTRKWLAEKWAPDTYAIKPAPPQSSVNINASSLHLSAVKQSEPIEGEIVPPEDAHSGAQSTIGGEHGGQ